MAMSTALGWVKPALDDHAAQARNALEYYAEDPIGQPHAHLRRYLHQVQGTLRMVELYAPAMVAESWSSMADALGADTVRQRDEAYSVPDARHGAAAGLPRTPAERRQGHSDRPDAAAERSAAVLGENLLSESRIHAGSCRRAAYRSAADGRAFVAGRTADANPASASGIPGGAAQMVPRARRTLTIASSMCSIVCVLCRTALDARRLVVEASAPECVAEVRSRPGVFRSSVAWSRRP
jgi:hypothetical protein